MALPEIGDIFNLDEDNAARDLHDRRRLDSRGNRLWHTDASYMPVPVAPEIPRAVTLPPPSPTAMARPGSPTGAAPMTLRPPRPRRLWPI